jgi:hypothetical protein
MSPSNFPTNSGPDWPDIVGATEPSASDHSRARERKAENARNRQYADSLARKPAGVEDAAEGPFLGRPEKATTHSAF